MRTPLILVVLSLAACKGRVDGDEDGFRAEIDCNDEDPSVYPGADELCDGQDNNCDGAIDEDGVDGPGYYLDGDGDGYGSASFPSTACTLPAGHVENADDCDDGDRRSYPGAAELCDQADNNCDGTADEDPTDAPTWYGDLDGDGYGKHTSGEEVSCTQPDGYVDNNDDCNDGDAALNPDAVWYADLDGDGYGGDFDTVACLEPDGFVPESTDCDDNDPDVSPGADEVCDGADNDCDGAIDDDDDDVVDPFSLYTDGDGDGYGSGDPVLACATSSGYATEGGDCDDTDPAISPGEAEVCEDAADNDCDGDADEGCPDAVVDDADVQFSGASSYDYFGYDLGFGDFDGDGDDDVVITAYGDDTVASGAGRAYIFDGPFSAGTVATSSAVASVYGDALSDYLGYAASVVPDLDGDGDDELLLGAYSNSGGSTDAGAAYLFLGPLSGSLQADDADLTVQGAASSDNLGYYLVSPAGDLTGDGVADLLLGAHNADVGSTASAAGAVYVVSGALRGVQSASAAAATLTGETAQDYVGYNGEGRFDLNGDGLADVAVGSSGADLVGLFYGPLSGSFALSAADVHITGGTSGDNTGSNLIGGDPDGDGYTDLLVGAKYDRDGGTYSGAWSLLTGPFTADLSMSADAVFKVSEAGASLYFGAQYQGVEVGDLDGDGVDDALLGSYTNDFYASSAGALYGFYGPLSGSLTVEDAQLFIGGSVANDYVGNAAALGDADGDGLNDVLLSARGRSSSAGLGAIFFGSGL